MSVLVLHIKLFLLIFMFIKVQIEKSSKNVKVDKIFLNEQKTLSIVFTLCSQVPIPCTLIQWWAKSNHDSILSRFERFESERFESQRRFDSNIVRFDSSTMRFDTDSIQILTIRFKRHAIWTEISKAWLKLNTHSHYSLLSQILSSNVWFYHHWCNTAIIRCLLLSGGGFERRDQCM